MKYRSALLAVLAALGLALCPVLRGANAPTPRPLDGYPVANFAVTANVSADGDLYGRILHNRGKLGKWLTDRGALRLLLVSHGREYPLSSFESRDVRRSFPFVEASLEGHEAVRSRLHYLAWAPMGLDDLDVTTLPVLQLELTLTNPTALPDTLTLVWRPDTLGKSPSYLQDYALDDLVLGCAAGGEAPALWPAAGPCCGASQACPAGLCGPGGRTVIVPAGGTKTLRLALSLYDERAYCARNFCNATQILHHVFDRWDALREATRGIETKIPHTGDPELDDYVRWYMVPGVALTKCTAQGQVVTLGYCELNQRDSYWASWLHLVMMPAAERKMIEESIEKMRPSGKIPTCILPRIDRKDDIDINAFFLLRCYRYYSYYGDLDLIRTHWEALCRAADWLLSRDLEGIGLPMQTSTWADWKDVSGVEGRKYSPYACLVYTAAMRRMATLAAALGDASAQEKYQTAADRADRRINLPRERGGLWNGHYYCQVWEDGRTDDRLLQDQTVGILLGAVPKPRARSIIKSLNRSNSTPYGICETYPYYPESFGYEPATYHNGGVWPWLSFADDWARVKMGRRKEAVSLIKRVARADLVDSGDWAANEHLNSLTGENLGFQLQGWNAGLYGLAWFGLGETDFKF